MTLEKPEKEMVYRLRILGCATIIHNIQECIFSLQACAINVHAHRLPQSERKYVDGLFQDFGSNDSNLGSTLGLWR